MELSDPEYNRRLDEFRADLRQPTAEVVQKHVLTGPVAAFDHADYFLLRNRVANTLKVQAVEVILVGSCRMGFTLVDKSRDGRPRYSPMRSASDLDIAVVSASLFDQLWHEVFTYAQADRAFATSADANRFRASLFKGWIEPRGLPPVAKFARAREWAKFFDELGRDRRYGNRRASARVYRTWERLAGYQGIMVDECKREVTRGER